MVLLLPDGIIFAPIKAVSRIVLSSGFTVWCKIGADACHDLSPGSSKMCSGRRAG